MRRPEVLASVLVDHAIAEAMVPRACPCDFGPNARYRLEELIGAGRCSQVYRARDRHLSSEGFSAVVAIKIMPAGAGLAREALAARRIAHPAVLSILDHGLCEDGSVYSVSEYIEGGDLSQAALPWPPHRAVKFVMQLARGVQAAHAAGVIHCDIKPSNVMVTADGDPKLVDFDLARWGDDDGASGRGNLAFMAPEQFRGEPTALAPPADVYALGGILYYTLTGRLPNGEDREQAARALSEGRSPPSPGVERDLDRICLRATAAPREARHHSAGELADDLERWLNREPIPWTRPGPIRRTRLLVRRRPVETLIVVGVLGAMASTAGVIAYNAAKERERVAKVQEEAMLLTRQEVARISERVRSHIRLLSQFAESTGATEDRLLPSIFWLELIVGSPLLQNMRPAAVTEQIRLLRALLKQAVSEGRGDHLDVMLARYTLAYYLTEDGQTEEALSLLETVRAHWTGRLPENDPLWLSVRGVEACARARLALTQNVPASEVRRNLRNIQTELLADGHCAPVVRLIDRLIAELPKQ